MNVEAIDDGDSNSLSTIGVAVEAHSVHDVESMLRTAGGAASV